MSEEDAPVEAPTESESISCDVECFLCDRCDAPLCKASEVITERAVVWSQAVYAYQLDILNQDTWCYSATNPSSNRFDVIRVIPSITNGRVKTHQRFFAYHTWFPGYSWSMCLCAACGQHLGWAFSPTEADDPNTDTQNDDAESCHSSSGEQHEKPSSATASTDAPAAAAASNTRTISFLGIICTHLTHGVMAPERFERLLSNNEERAAAFDQYRRQLAGVFPLLATIPDQFAANQLGMLILQMQHNPAMRDMMPQVAAQIRQLHEVQAQDPMVEDDTASADSNASTESSSCETNEQPHILENQPSDHDEHATNLQAGPEEAAGAPVFAEHSSENANSGSEDHGG